MGRNTTIGADKKYIYNHTGYKWFRNALGDDIAEPKNLKQANVDQNSTDENFNGTIAYCGITGTGGAITGATGEQVTWITESGNIFDYFVLGAGQTITTFPRTANGIDVTMDAVNDEGVEIWQGNNAYAKHAYTAQTDRFYIQAKFKIAAVAEYDECMVGFRKVEAGQEVLGTYTDYISMNVDNGKLKVLDAVGGTDTATDTTDTVSDTNYIIARMEYDDRVALQRVIALANEAKIQYNKHIADITMHTTAADTVNVVTAADAIDLATAKTLIGDLLTQYDAHEGDSELVGGWAFHPAQETGDDSLASSVAPTTLALCCTRLNDLKAKYNAHEVDATSHAITTGLHQISGHNAGAVTFYKGINTETLTEPTIYPSYVFTDALVVIPFFRQLHDNTAASLLELMEWKVDKIA